MPAFFLCIQVMSMNHHQQLHLGIIKANSQVAPHIFSIVNPGWGSQQSVF